MRIILNEPIVFQPLFEECEDSVKSQYDRKVRNARLLTVSEQEQVLNPPMPALHEK
jgi:hypothetical protein